MDDSSAIPASVAVALVSLAALVVVGLVVGASWADTASTARDHTHVESVSGNETVTITYIDGSGEHGAAVVAGVDPVLSSGADGWAIVERTDLPSPLQAVSGESGSEVVGFGEWALVGASTNATVSIGAAELTVVAPAGRGVDPARKAGFLRQFVDPYALDPDTPEQVILVAAPAGLTHEGAMYADDRGYVTIEAFWDGDVGSVWIHEYLHARQNFRLGSGMVWFREASAEYLSYRIMEKQYGEVTESDVRERLAAFPAHEAAVLANQTTWRGTSANYHVGARLLAAVDAEIRADTDGEQSLVDVFRAMNGRDESVSVADFVSIVERYTGEEESWIAAAIRGEEDVDGLASS